MYSCHETTRLLSEAQERPLLFSEKVALKIHTLICGRCHNFEKHMGVVRQAARRFADGEFTKK